MLNLDNKIQFKRDHKQNSKKLHLDQYYTPIDLATYCITKTIEVVGRENITKIIEPSAGNGSFSSQLDCFAYDIEPKADGIIKLDFLEYYLPYEKGTLVIGNPPYGSSLNLAKAFCNKAFDVADYVSFILPISQLNNTQSIYKFDLVHSEDLGKRDYSGMEVHCCLNIYKRPEQCLNKRVSYKDSEIIEIREVRINEDKTQSRELGDFEYDFGICAWGNGVGVECKEGDYVRTFYIKIKDVDNFEYYKNLIINADWKSIYPMTSTPNLTQWQVYKYVDENRKVD